MHRISAIKVQNFKSIKDAEFNLSPYTPLVGYNNAGKTNILQALSWLVKKTSLQAGDFFDTAQPITVTAEISGVDAGVLDALGGQHRQRIEPLVVDGKISIRRTQVEPGQSTSAIRFEVFSDADGWGANPNGIDAAITHLFPEPISIGAMENATDDVGKYAAGTTIGKLIKEIVDDVAARNAGQVTAALADVASRLSADGAAKDETLVDLDGKIQTELSKFFPGVTAKTHIQVPEFSDFLKSATIKIYDNQYDNANGRDASAFGHGAQRSVQIALIKCLSEIKRAAAVNAARTTLLLIDEPELYLHPQAIELVRAALSRLSSEGYQVVFSTHSANMIARSDAENVLLVRRTAADGTRAIPRLQDAVRAAIAGAAHQSETLFLLSNSIKVLFCEKLLLAEGKTERVLFPDLFSHEHGLTLDEDKLGLIEVGGSSNIPSALKVLAAMGTSAKAIVDLDFIFKVAPKHNLISEIDPSIVACKAIFNRIAKTSGVILKDDLPVNSNLGTAAAGFALMAAEADARAHLEALHTHMRGHRIWFWKNGTIETHLGLNAKSAAAHLAFLNDFKNPVFRGALPDYAEVQAMFLWARQP